MRLRRRLLACFCIWFGLLPTLVTGSACAADSDGPFSLTVKRGLTAQLQFSHSSSTLKAIPDQSIDAQLLVRLERTELGGTALGQQNSDYTLWFFGTVAGDYDLSQFIVESDGLPLAANESLPAMMAHIVSDLPPGHGTNLYELDDPRLQAPGGYRATLIAFAVLWAAVPAIWGFLYWRARQPVQPIAVVQLPTLADRLRPLVQRASEGQLSVEEQSRLEMLIYVYWQRRLNLSESLVDALPLMRRHEQAGGLLRAMEAWIHDDNSLHHSLDPSTMEALLAPYHASLNQADENQINQTEDVVSVQPRIVGGTA